MRTLVIYMAIGIVIGIVTTPWRRTFSEKTGYRLCLWVWGCFWPLVLVQLAWIGIRDLVRKGKAK